MDYIVTNLNTIEVTEMNENDLLYKFRDKLNSSILRMPAVTSAMIRVSEDEVYSIKRKD